MPRVNLTFMHNYEQLSYALLINYYIQQRWIQKWCNSRLKAATSPYDYLRNSSFTVTAVISRW